MEHKDLNRRLEALPNPLRVAVGAAAVERVLPLFEAMSDVGSESMRGALAVAWRYARGETVDLAELARSSSRCGGQGRTRRTSKPRDRSRGS
jgi:hypothetical protein